jgi:Glyoxalase/Bleomycin resistance protein/Dioxygenase superfamily
MRIALVSVSAVGQPVHLVADEAKGQIMHRPAGAGGRQRPQLSDGPESSDNHISAFPNIRVADIAKVCEEWLAKGAEFLTEPKDHGREIRGYIRDPDGHFIEVVTYPPPSAAERSRTCRWSCTANFLPQHRDDSSRPYN